MDRIQKANKKLILRAVAVCLLLTMLVTAFPKSAMADAANTEYSAARVSTQSTALNVRSYPSASSQRVGLLNKGTYVITFGTYGGWTYVEYAKGSFGWCSTAYLTPVDGYAARVATNGGGLNLRYGAGMGYGITTALTNGTRLWVIGGTGGWLRVVCNGTLVGYVSAAYVSESTPGNNGNTAYAPINLSVPYYRQTDPRWANVILGTSGQTMGSIGCTTCCVAMVESYITGAAIRPDVMANRLSYTAGGALYWPSDYAFIYDGSNWMERAYELLSLGKPVIFCARRANGSTHWVVITGYMGGNTLSASDFIINDPGNSSRTTLAQLFATCPYFVKMVYHQ